MIAVVASGCSNCENEILTEVPSPAGDRRAVVFQRACDATTGFSTQVSLLGSGELASTAGNVFVANTDHEQAPAGPGGGPAITVEWVGADTLVIHHDTRARIFRSDTLHDGITVRYVPRSSR